MKIYYDQEVDALYLQFADDKPEGVTEMEGEVNLDLTEDGRIVGIEILDASKKLNVQTILSYNLELNEKLLTKSAKVQP